MSEIYTIGYRPADRDKGISIAEPEVGLRRVMRLLDSGISIMLMCACKDYGQCHRKVVYEMIIRGMSFSA